MSRNTFGAVLVVAVLVAGSAAFGHPTRIEDPIGDGGNLEISRAVQRHLSRSKTNFVRFIVTANRSFDNGELKRQENYPSLTIGVSTDKDENFERVLYVDVVEDASAQGSLYGVVTAGRQRSDSNLNLFTELVRTVGYVKVWRPKANSVAVEVPESLLKRGGVNSFRWRVRWVHSEPGVTSFDYAPDGGLARGHSE